MPCWYVLLIFISSHLIPSESSDSNLNPVVENHTSVSSNLTDLTLTILGALTNEQHIEILNSQTNRSLSISSDLSLFISSQSFLLQSNPLLIAMKLCEVGLASRAKAIIAGRGSEENDLTLTAISYVSDFYHVPVLTIASRENLFSDKVG